MHSGAIGLGLNNSSWDGGIEKLFTDIELPPSRGRRTGNGGSRTGNAPRKPLAPGHVGKIKR